MSGPGMSLRKNVSGTMLAMTIRCNNNNDDNNNNNSNNNSSSSSILLLLFIKRDFSQELMALYNY